MRGRLTLQGLEQAVAEGAIDTVLVAQTDMQGRLMGKRFQAEFFLTSAHRETHGCNYLLATDYEMETVPGYEATGWAAGYGDYVMRPTCRRCAASPGSRAPRWCSATSSTTTATPRCRIRRAPCSSRQIAPAGGDGLPRDDGVRARVLPLRAVLPRRPCRRLPRPHPGQPLQRGLPHLPDHQGGGGDAGDPHRAQRRGHPGRELQGRGQRRPGGDQRPATTRRSPPPTPTPSSRTAPRRSPGPRAARSPSWPSPTPAPPAPPATSTSRCAPPTAAPPSTTPAASTACRR